MVNRHPYIVDVLRKLIRCPLFLAFRRCKEELMDGVTTEGGIISFDNRIVTVDSHRSIIVRDRKGEDLPVQLFLAVYRFIKLYDTSHGYSHAMSVLSVSDIKCRSIALDFACKEGKIHPVGCNEIEGLPDATDKRTDLPKLLVRECGSSESNRVIWFRLGTFYWYAAHPAFVGSCRI